MNARLCRKRLFYMMAAIGIFSFIVYSYPIEKTRLKNNNSKMGTTSITSTPTSTTTTNTFSFSSTTTFSSSSTTSTNSNSNNNNNSTGLSVTTADDFVPYTFDDPLEYKGPVLSGWPPEKSRETSLYIRPEQNTLLSNLSCGANFTGIKLLVVVQSAPFMHERRQLARDTFGQFTKELNGVMVLFLFGTHESENKTLLEEEQETNCDLVQMDFVDDYENVTLDTLMAFKLALSMFNNLKFLVIADDDSYLNLKGLHRELFEVDNATLREDDLKIWGFQLLPDVHYPDKAMKDRAVLPRDPFPFSPSYMFNQPKYPPFLTGGAYVLPFGTLDCLYRASLKLPIYHINDVFITGFVRQECKLNLVSDGRFVSHWMAPSEVLKLGKELILYHQGSEEGRRILDYILRVQQGVVDQCKANYYCFEKEVLVHCDAPQNCSKVALKDGHL